MSILDIRKKTIFYLSFTIFCVLFGAIYEYFSHGIYTLFMSASFLIPLILGLIPYGILYMINIGLKSNIFTDLYDYSIIILTIGSIVKGILIIFGTSNSLTYVYLYLGIGTLLLSIICMIINNIKLKK